MRKGSQDRRLRGRPPLTGTLINKKMWEEGREVQGEPGENVVLGLEGQRLQILTMHQEKRGLKVTPLPNWVVRSHW